MAPSVVAKRLVGKRSARTVREAKLLKPRLSDCRPSVRSNGRVIRLSEILSKIKVEKRRIKVVVSTQFVSSIKQFLRGGFIVDVEELEKQADEYFQVAYYPHKDKCIGIEIICKKLMNVCFKLFEQEFQNLKSYEIIKSHVETKFHIINNLAIFSIAEYFNKFSKDSITSDFISLFTKEFCTEILFIVAESFHMKDRKGNFCSSVQFIFQYCVDKIILYLDKIKGSRNMIFPTVDFNPETFTDVNIIRDSLIEKCSQHFIDELL